MRTHFKIHTDHAFLYWLIDLVKASERLMRWRLRLLEVDFEVVYNERTLKTQAPLPRLVTTAEAEPFDNLEILCFVVENDEQNTEDW